MSSLVSRPQSREKVKTQAKTSEKQKKKKGPKIRMSHITSCVCPVDALDKEELCVGLEGVLLADGVVPIFLYLC